MRRSHAVALRIAAAPVLCAVAAAVLLWTAMSSWDGPARWAAALPWPDGGLRWIIENGRVTAARMKALKALFHDGADDDYSFRLATDPKMPLEIRIGATDWLAVDGTHLPKIVATSADANVVVHALNRLTSSDSPEAVVAPFVHHVTNQKVLSAIGSGADASEARRLAVLRMTDLDALLHIAETDQHWAVRLAAAGHLAGDDRIFALLHAMKDAPSDFCAAVDHIVDRDRLARVGAEDADERVREAVAACLSDPEALSHMADTDSSPTVRLTAAQGLCRTVTKAPNLLISHVALSNPDARVREAAVGCLENEAALEKVAKTDAVSGIRAAAIARVKDESFLLGLVHANQDGALKSKARGRLRELLRPSAADGHDSRIEQVATKDRDPIMRGLAVGWLADDELLRKIAQSDPAREVRSAAHLRLEARSNSGKASDSYDPFAAVRRSDGSLPSSHDPARNHNSQGVSLYSRY